MSEQINPWTGHLAKKLDKGVGCELELTRELLLGWEPNSKRAEGVPGGQPQGRASGTELDASHVTSFSPHDSRMRWVLLPTPVLRMREL